VTPTLAIRRRASSGAQVVELHGEFDASNAHTVVAEIADLGPDQPIVLDLSGLTFIDATCLRALLAVRADMRRRRRAFALVCPRGTVAFRLFSLAGVIGRLPAFQTEDAAVADLAGRGGPRRQPPGVGPVARPRSV